MFQDLVLRSYSNGHDVFVFLNHPIGGVKSTSEMTATRKKDNVEKAKLTARAVESAGKEGWHNSVVLRSHSNSHDAFVF